MAERHLPVRPNLDQLRHQAKDLLRDLKAGEAEAVAALARHHPRTPVASAAKLSDAQLVLARQYGVASWPRLVLACRMTDAICRDDLATVRDLVLAHPELIDEDARGVKGNWGPPMSYAANLGRDAIIDLLHGLGAKDLQFAFDRACLQGRLTTARKLYDFGARPEAGAVMGPCETLNGDGLAFVLDLGASIADEKGDPLAPLGLILQTYCRNPRGKRRCLELMNQHGITLPDTPTMAVHRGRIDLLEDHLRRDSDLFHRTFTHDEIWPRTLGCDEDQSLALHGTPLAGGTLLHLSVDDDSIDLAEWMLAHGADPDAPAAVDDQGFGGHTALFGCVVSQPYRCSIRTDDTFARLLLDHGADPRRRASLRKRLRFVDDETEHVYRDVDPLDWGRRFHDQAWVNPTVMACLRERTV